jgi:hypothetical protein
VEALRVLIQDVAIDPALALIPVFRRDAYARIVPPQLTMVPTPRPANRSDRRP